MALTSLGTPVGKSSDKKSLFAPFPQLARAVSSRGALKSRDKDRAVHNELERAELRRTVEDALDERGVVRATALGDIAVEFGAGLAGDDDAGFRGGRGV